MSSASANSCPNAVSLLEWWLPGACSLAGWRSVEHSSGLHLLAVNYGEI